MSMGDSLVQMPSVAPDEKVVKKEEKKMKKEDKKEE